MIVCSQRSREMKILNDHIFIHTYCETKTIKKYIAAGDIILDILIIVI